MKRTIETVFSLVCTVGIILPFILGGVLAEGGAKVGAWAMALVVGVFLTGAWVLSPKE